MTVTLYVTSDKEQLSAGNERRFEESMLIGTLKGRLELITGSLPGDMRLQLLNNAGEVVASLDDDDRPLGFYPVADFLTLFVRDVNPARRRNEFSDLSQVEKWEMDDEDYEKRPDSVRRYKQVHKLGRFAPDAPDPNELFSAAASAISVGQRCEAMTESGTQRGTVAFVGKVTDPKLPGYWIGIALDLPLGKHDGMVGDQRYFTCPNKCGIFLRPDRLTVGDFPAEDDGLDDLEEL